MRNYKKDLDRFGKANRMKLEVTAWDYAEKLLKDFGFKDWDYFKKHKNDGLKSYS